MPIFKCFFKIIWKNKGTIIMYTGILLGLIFILSSATATERADTYKDTAVTVAVIDRDGTSLSAALTSYLGSRHKLVDLQDNVEKLQDAMFYRYVGYILIIPQGFENGVLNGSDDIKLENVKLPNSTSGIYLDNQIDRYIATLNVYLNSGFTQDEAVNKTQTDLELVTAVEMLTEGEGISETGKSSYYFQYLSYIIMVVLIGSLGPVLIAFNKSDLARRIESSSIKFWNRNAQTALGMVASSFAIWCVFIIIACIIYGSDMLSVMSLYKTLNSLVYLTVSISITFLLGQLMKSINALNAVNNAVSLGMSFLCGIFVPQELLGSGVLSISRFLPAYWYIRSNDMMFSATTMSESNMRIYVEGIGIQLGFSVAILTVALLISRQKKVRALV